MFEMKSHNIGHFCSKVFMQTERWQAGERDGIPAVPDRYKQTTIIRALFLCEACSTSVFLNRPGINYTGPREA